VDADKNLRRPLPYAKGSSTTYAAALLNLGIANYQYGKMTMNKARILEGAKFSEQCAGIQGSMAQEAWHNAQAMKAEADRMR